MGDIPQTRDTDHDDVTLALQVARSQLGKGDLAEAVKWLRKAADAAFDNDDDRRGIELSKAAAELQASPPKPAKPPVPNKPSMPAPRSVVPLGPKVPKPVVPSAAQVTKARSEAPPPPPARPIAQPSSPTSKKPSRGRMPSVHKMRKLEEEEATRELDLKKHRMPASPPAAAPVEAPVAEPVADEWPTESVQATDLVEIPPVPVPVAQALRIAVSRGPDGNVCCRLLDEHGLRAGEHDAMLVALTPESDLVGVFKG